MSNARLASFVTIAALATGLVARPALAASDLEVSVSLPPTVRVYQPARYAVRVTNVQGSTSARGTLTLQLPRTHTSPTVYVLGTVGAMTTGCSRTGTQIVCPVAQLRRGAFQDFFVDLTLPQNAGPLEITATVDAAGDLPTSNNRRTMVVDPENPAAPIGTTTDHAVDNRHCTGVGLTSYFECTLFSGSVSSHAATFRPDGSIAIPAAPGYGGRWWQPFDDQLAFTYTDGSATIAQFVGGSVGNGCFEGITSFPGSTYVAPYRVCVAP